MRLARKRSRSGEIDLVQLRHRVPARLRSPGGDRRPPGEQRGGGGALLGIEDHRLAARDAVREVFEERVLGKGGVAVVLLDPGPRRHGREFRREGDEILRRVGRPRRDIDQRRDLRIVARLADDGAGPGMPDQHGRPVLQRQGAARRGDGIGERGQRILHRRHMQPGRLQKRDDLAPAGPVGPGAVDEDDVAGLRGLAG